MLHFGCTAVKTTTFFEKKKYVHLNNNRALTLPEAIALYRYVVNLT